MGETMTDDILTRLRNACDSNNCWCPMINERCIYMEAADEIERLTADRDRWRSIAERAMDLLEEANRVLARIQEGLKHD